jgi:hypothetical protein
MPLNIKQFAAALHKHDVERPNLFAVDITIPDYLRTFQDTSAIISSTDGGRLVSLYCKSANLPGLNIATADAQRYGVGPSIKMPIRGSLNDISLSFLNDSNSFVYSFFYNWINSIYPQTNNLDITPGNDSTYLHPFKKDYQTTVLITNYHGKPGQFNGGGLLQTLASVASAAAGVPFIGSLLGSRSLPDVDLVQTKQYKFIKMYPTNISDISLSSSSTDTATEFSVGFTYQTFEMTLGDGTATEAAPGLGG